MVVVGSIVVVVGEAPDCVVVCGFLITYPVVVVAGGGVSTKNTHPGSTVTSTLFP